MSDRWLKGYEDDSDPRPLPLLLIPTGRLKIQIAIGIGIGIDRVLAVRLRSLPDLTAWHSDFDSDAPTHSSSRSPFILDVGSLYQCTFVRSYVPA